jgi:hypothetical protein
MNPLPSAQEGRNTPLKLVSNTDQFACGETVVLPQCNRTRSTIQSEYGFVTVPNDVYMSWTMIIWVNSHAQSANPQNGWHELILSQT